MAEAANDPLFLYVTMPSLDSARALAKKLVAARLAACTNLLPGMISVYEWQGKIEETQEVVMIVKTTRAAAMKAREMIVTEHPYECPCIVALPVETGMSHPPFVEWIRGNVG